MQEGFDHIFDGFSFNTELVFTGHHCDIEEFEEFTTGVVHFVRDGIADLEIKGMDTIKIRQPSLIFFPRPNFMRFTPVDEVGITLICAHTSFNVGNNHPLALSFPDVVVIALEKLSPIKSIIEIFFEEALSLKNYKKQATDKLSSLILIHMTRYLIEHKLMYLGLISAMSNKKVADSLEVIHSNYSHKLTLDSVAKEIGISRSQFAELFSKLLGQTFFEYLTSHRIRVAQRLLKENKSVKVVASSVGFSSSSSFIRKFKEETGVSPGKWL
ncbi:MAG: helix-turn-helix transcriptional regulator [Methylophilaceae bacterium]